jgi:[protein-PII] uridylyltransferase
VGWALDPPAGTAPGWAGAVATLADRGYLHVDDIERLEVARERLLDARVALQRSTGSRSNQLALQDQDVVARVLGVADADALVRSLGEAARAVAWTGSDMWSRLLATEEGPRRRATGYRDLGNGLSLRDGRLALDPDVAVDTATVLELAASAATLRCQIERSTLDRIAVLEDVEWTPRARDAFIELLRGGRNAIGVFETLDHVGVLVRLLPEWAHVRALPQRNAYHRFTVDRHSLEAVAECAALLDPSDAASDGLDGEIATRTRADVVLLAALLHDIGKGRPGDHSEAGARTAVGIARRIGIDEAGIEMLAWLVEHHLLLAETATRRDLGDERTISRFARAVGTSAHLDALYTLTIGDSRATGSAAWGLNKAALMRDLWIKTDTLLAQGVISSPPVEENRVALRGMVGSVADDYLDAMPPSYAGAFPPDVLAHHRELVASRDLAIEWGTTEEARLMCTVIAPDRTGLLATAAGALALLGVDIVSAAGYSHPDGIAIEIFTGVDPYGRLVTGEDRARGAQLLRDAIDGTLPLADRLEERTRRYRPRVSAPGARDVEVVVDLDASAFATVVEVHAADDVGLLARVATVFADLDLGVTQAIVSTVGDRVVDVFYLRDADGRKFVDAAVIERVRDAVLARLAEPARPGLGAT